MNAVACEVQHAALSILLLEDNAFDAELASEALRGNGCTIRAVATRGEYLVAIVEGGFDVVLSDFSIPGFSGIEALQLAQQHCPEVPFVFLSGVLGEEHAVDMLKRGATDYVVKSRLERLPLVVERAIAEARERRHRQQAERALREYEHTFSRVIESLEDYAVILLAPDGTIRNCNRATERIFGVRPQEIIGRAAAQLYPPAERLAGCLDRELAAATRDGRCSDERWLQRGDGAAFFASSVTTAFRDDAGELSGFSKIVRDTTEAHAAAETLRQAKLSAERASQAKDRFIAVLSHELRTPLVPILNGAQLLQMQLPALQPKLADVLAMIQRNALLEARLIDDLLDVTSIERGKLVLDLQPLDAHDSLRAALDTAAEQIDRKRLQVELRLKATDAWVNADGARLQQIFWNLINNAVKFTPAGGVLCIATDTPQPGRLRVVVRDNGIGIRHDALQRIFTPFEQADDSGRSGRGGLGLGLAIARGLAERHGGQLTAHSDGEGCGAEFSLMLDMIDPSRVAAADSAPLPAQASDGVEVLLVEDNADSEAVLTRSLEMFGHRVLPVRTVAAALQAIETRRFDLVVSDIGLPDGSGLDVAAALAGRCPAIALSGFGMDEDQRASLAAGFVRHLIKPLDGRQLKDAVDEVLRHGGAAPLESRRP